jgi:hypothetical protein
MTTQTIEEPDFFRPFPTVPIPMSSLRGPADADHFRTFHGRSKHRWYVDPLPADERWSATGERDVYPAVSTVKKASGNDWTMVGYKRAAEAIVADPKRFKGRSYDEVYDMLNADNKRGLGRASTRGTNVHTYFEKGLRGFDITFAESPREPGANYLPAVRAFFAAHKPKLVAAEVVCIHRDLNRVGPDDEVAGCGGTADGFVEITCPDGKRRLAAIDWKSRADEGKHAIYPEEAAQVGFAGRAQYMIVEGPLGAMRTEIPPLELGLIVSIRPDGFRCYPVDLDKAFRHFTSMHAWWKARQSERDTYGRIWPPSPTLSLEEQLALTTSREEALDLWKRNKAAWTEEMSKAMTGKWPKP